MPHPWLDRSSLVAFGAVVVLLGTSTTARGENIDPANNGSQYAYAENVGWINAEPLGNGGPGMQVGDFSVTGRLWSENAGWINLSCANGGSCGAVAYGVTNNGEGVLGGFAWGENVGWVNFAPTAAGVSIDPATGAFQGRAWSENVGWITFASTGSIRYSVTTGWCAGVVAPTASPLLLVTRLSGMDISLSWSTVPGAILHDVVRGRLSTLRASHGAFNTSTEQCLANSTTATSLVFSGTPAAGDGYWFLVRGANCRGGGTYNTGAASQVGSRDAEIAASAGACP